MDWLFHRHVWVTRFRGQYTKGIECSVCGKAKLIAEFNAENKPMGWIDEL